VPAQLHTDVAKRTQMNLAISFATQLGQVGLFLPNLQGVDFPHYRLRFYTDARRQQVVFDLPPPPPAIGPNGLPQEFSVDPGRALITGDPLDWEAFEVPPLAGIAQTAPYFHDNLATDLETVVDLYSRNFLPSFPALELPPIVPPAGPGLPFESLDVTEKAELVSYLRTL
jgi:hypothetical protein